MSLYQKRMVVALRDCFKSCFNIVLRLIQEKAKSPLEVLSLVNKRNTNRLKKKLKGNY